MVGELCIEATSIYYEKHRNYLMQMTDLIGCNCQH